MFKHACLVLLLSYAFLNLANNTEDDLSKRICKSLINVLDYIYDNRHTMNVDGLFGVVFVKVNLEKLDGKLKYLDKHILTSLIDKTAKILEANNFLETNMQYKILHTYVLDANLWQSNINFSLGHFNKDLIQLDTELKVRTCSDYKTYMENDYFSEDISDECILQLVKSSTEALAPQHCQIDRLCNNYMIGSDIVPAYGNTHRLLFLQIAKARKCHWNKKWLTNRIKKYCLFIYWEAQKNAECGFIPEFDDLFLEQILLCGYEGFIEFLPRNWMEHVLNIQTEHGCFGIFNSTSSVNRSELRRRRKREANLMKFGCLDHTTGLGAGVLSLFLRFLAEHIRILKKVKYIN